MFHLALLEDIVKINPKYLIKPIKEAVHDELLKRYANKVLKQYLTFFKF